MFNNKCECINIFRDVFTGAKVEKMKKFNGRKNPNPYSYGLESKETQ